MRNHNTRLDTMFLHPTPEHGNNLGTNIDEYRAKP